MPAFTDMMPAAPGDLGRFRHREPSVLERVEAIKTINFSRLDQAEVLSVRVGPQVIGTTLNVQRAGSNQCEQLVLVNVESILIVAIFKEIVAPPIRDSRWGKV